MSTFFLISAGAWLLLVTLAWTRRSRTYAIFRGVMLAIHTLIAAGMAGWFRGTPEVWALFVFLHATVFVHALGLVRATMMPSWYRVLVSIPGSFFAAGTFLALPWAVLGALGFSPWLPQLPYALALVGLVQSLRLNREQVHLVVGDERQAPTLQRMAHGSTRSDRPLTLVQITDPHLGPFMPVARLRRISERAVAANPDLVLLTGDFLTMESQRDPELLRHALEPLAALPGRVFACRGNHDHEAPETVAQALAQNGIRLLNDNSELVQTEAGPVQILGIDFIFGRRAERIRAVCENHPRIAGALRLVLLHDPGAFVHLPEGDGDLVLSGHTHGGQIGFLSLGLSATLVSLFSRLPDHGFWGRGSDRLYVHRGTGHYGFPLRVGVPAEESVVHVHATFAP